ncbi:MAG: xanthine dehydrogenase family protein molybdopterin-binding subunit [Fusobacteriaceae bacterium]
MNSSIKKVDSLGIITGKPLYTDDLSLNNNIAIVKLLRSPHAFAEIEEIDVSIAKKIPGIIEIYTYKDVPNTKFTLAGQSYPEPSPYDRKILEKTLRYIGDPVAIVVAIDEKTSMKAMSLIKVKYQVLLPVLDYEKALDSDIIIHKEKAFTNYNIGYDNTRNLASSVSMEKPGVEEGFEKSDVIIERTYRTQAQMHGMMETQRAMSYMDENNRLVVISSTQIPFHVRRHLARALEISPSLIRVIKPRIGGGFGAKQTATMEMYCAFVTLKTGKPAKHIFTREEACTCSTTRHSMRIKIKIGSDKVGNIKAIDINTISNAGAYGEHAPTVTPLIAYKSFPLYAKVPMKFRADIVYSNTMVAGAFRGYGATQGAFAIESIINELAKKLKIDETEIRMKNLVETNSEIIKNEDESISLGKNYVSGDIKKCIEIGKKQFNWDLKREKREVAPGIYRGAGMAVTMQGSGIAGLDTAAATIKLNEVGHFTLMVGATDMGQGSDTVLSQIAAEILEVPMSKIVIRSADTDTCPFDPGAYASSGTYVTGNAVLLAGKKMKEKILEEASIQMNEKIDDLKYFGDYIESTSGKKIELDVLANNSISFARQNQITVTATWGGKTSPPPFIASFAEVEIDSATGEVKIINFLSVVDCGLRVNPNLARVQVEGGIAQGIGLALYEDVQYTEKGKVKNNTFMQYKIPGRKDIGTGIEVLFSDSIEATGPLGAKSIGEVVVNSPAPAIADAIYNVTGYRGRQLPITSEKIYFYLKNHSKF